MKKILCIFMAALMFLTLSLVGCEKEDDVKESGFYDLKSDVEVDFSAPRNVNYRPEGVGALADVIPFYHGGKFELFYLYDHRGALKIEGTPWYLIETENMVNFTERGLAIANSGDHDADDTYAFTGSVIEKDGVFHAFYTGHNPYIPQQVILHATSTDLVNWTTIPEDTLHKADRHEGTDFRDPYVFWYEEEQCYVMLVCVKLKSAPFNGAVDMYKSTDLSHWELADSPLHVEYTSYLMECPDVFRMGDWWYLVYYCSSTETKYLRSKSLYGPWENPTDFDGENFCAAKTATDGERRYLFGWNPTKNGTDDSSANSWGGNLIVYEIYPLEDGTLATKMPNGVYSAFSAKAYEGKDLTFGDSYGIEAEYMNFGLPEAYRVSFDVEMKGAANAGVFVNASPEAGDNYSFQFCDEMSELAFGYCNGVRFDNYAFANRSRAYDFAGKVHCEIVVEKDIATIYIDNKITLTVRMMRDNGNDLAFFSDGGAVFSNIAVYGYGKSRS